MREHSFLRHFPPLRGHGTSTEGRRKPPDWGACGTGTARVSGHVVQWEKHVLWHETDQGQIPVWPCTGGTITQALESLHLRIPSVGRGSWQLWAIKMRDFLECTGRHTGGIQYTETLLLFLLRPSRKVDDSNFSLGEQERTPRRTPLPKTKRTQRVLPNSRVGFTMTAGKDHINVGTVQLFKPQPITHFSPKLRSEIHLHPFLCLQPESSCELYY